MRTVRLLDVCSGTGTLSKWAEDFNSSQNIYKIEVTSIDILPRVRGYEPTFVRDIVTWNFASELPQGGVDIVWASPPCTQYSRAKTKGSRDMDGADKIVKACFDIIEHVQPVVFVVENPATGYLRTREIMRGIPYSDADLCQYGMPYQKPTRLWSNFSEHLHLKRCDRSTCPSIVNGKHIVAVGGDPSRRIAGSSRWLFGSMPHALISDVMTTALQQLSSSSSDREAYAEPPTLAPTPVPEEEPPPDGPFALQNPYA
jgi:hypothetical protein